jgi:hypothetical protein
MDSNQMSNFVQEHFLSIAHDSVRILPENFNFTANIGHRTRNRALVLPEAMYLLLSHRRKINSAVFVSFFRSKTRLLSSQALMPIP